MELLERVAQVLVVLVVDGEQARVNHGLGLAIALERRVAGVVHEREGVAYVDRLGVLESRDHKADLAHADVEGELGGTTHAHAVDEKLLAALHHAQVIALLDLTIEDANRRHHAAVFVEVRVEDEGLERACPHHPLGGLTRKTIASSRRGCPRPSCRKRIPRHPPEWRARLRSPS